MKLLFEFLPIIFFFVAYKFAGIYAATVAAIIVTVIQVFFTWVQGKKVQLVNIITLALILIFGLATLLLKDELYIKWKPTVINWLFGCFFIASHFFSKKTVIEKLMSHQIELPKNIWLRLNFSWAIFFLLMGTINLYVVYHFSTDFWVNFKLFGILGLTIIFVILQSIYMTQYLNVTKNKN